MNEKVNYFINTTRLKKRRLHFVIKQEITMPSSSAYNEDGKVKLCLGRYLPPKLIFQLLFLLICVIR